MQQGHFEWMACLLIHIFSLLHSIRGCSCLRKSFANGVGEYSTLGGTSGYTRRSANPFSTRCFRAEASIFSDTCGMVLNSSLKRIVPCSSRRRSTTIAHLLPSHSSRGEAGQKSRSNFFAFSCFRNPFCQGNAYLQVSFSPLGKLLHGSIVCRNFADKIWHIHKQDNAENKHILQEKRRKWNRHYILQGKCGDRHTRAVRSCFKWRVAAHIPPAGFAVFTTVLNSECRRLTRYGKTWR